MLDHVCESIPVDSEDKTLPCISRREESHKNLVVMLVGVLSTHYVEAWVAYFLDHYLTRIPELEDEE